MKKTSLKVVLLVAIFSAFLMLGLTACGKDRTPKSQLDAPENVHLSINLTAEDKTEFLLKWDKVGKAKTYNILVGGVKLRTTQTIFNITEYVKINTQMTIDVWAEGNADYRIPSKETTIKVTPKEVSANLKFSTIDGGY